MAPNCTFYVTQGGLQVFDGDRVEASGTFQDNDADLRAFEAFLNTRPPGSGRILVDVIEEVFAQDNIPRLGRSDRNALLDRRVTRKFPRTPYRLAMAAPRTRQDKQEVEVAYSAISNHELVDPWLAILLRHKTPLTGIYSVPHLVPYILKRLRVGDDPVLYLAQHQGNKLRQVFVADGLVRSARLAQSPDLGSPEYASFVTTEVNRSRRYLERSRLLGHGQRLPVCAIAAAPLAERITAVAGDQQQDEFQFFSPATVAKRLGVPAQPLEDRLESLCISVLNRRRPANDYARDDDRRYWTMHRLRSVLVGFGFLTATACALLAGVVASDAWRLHVETAEVEAQVQQLAETYRRDNQSMQPIKADSHEMKLAVDSGDFILRQRVPVPWVLQQLGYVLGDYPQVQLRELSWQISSTAEQSTDPRRQQSDTPVRIPRTDLVTAELVGVIEPFDGDLRAAFATIDGLAADIEAGSAFNETIVSEYPVNPHPSATLSGEVGSADNDASFRLRLRFAPMTVGSSTEEPRDDSV